MKEHEVPQPVVDQFLAEIEVIAPCRTDAPVIRVGRGEAVRRLQVVDRVEDSRFADVFPSLKQFAAFLDEAVEFRDGGCKAAAPERELRRENDPVRPVVVPCPVRNEEIDPFCHHVQRFAHQHRWVEVLAHRAEKLAHHKLFAVAVRRRRDQLIGLRAPSVIRDLVDARDMLVPEGLHQVAADRHGIDGLLLVLMARQLYPVLFAPEREGADVFFGIQFRPESEKHLPGVCRAFSDLLPEGGIERDRRKTVSRFEFFGELIGPDPSPLDMPEGGFVVKRHDDSIPEVFGEPGVIRFVGEGDEFSDRFAVEVIRELRAATERIHIARRHTVEDHDLHAGLLRGIVDVPFKDRDFVRAAVIQDDPLTGCGPAVSERPAFGQKKLPQVQALRAAFGIFLLEEPAGRPAGKTVFVPEDDLQAGFAGAFQREGVFFEIFFGHVARVVPEDDHDALVAVFISEVRELVQDFLARDLFDLRVPDPFRQRDHRLRVLPAAVISRAAPAFCIRGKCRARRRMRFRCRHSPPGQALLL